MTKTKYLKPKFGKRKNKILNERRAKKRRQSPEQQLFDFITNNTTIQRNVFQYFDSKTIESIELVCRQWNALSAKSWKLLYATQFMNNDVNVRSLSNDAILYKRLYKLHSKVRDINWTTTRTKIIEDDGYDEQYTENIITKQFIIAESVIAYVYKIENETEVTKSAQYSIYLFSTMYPVMVHLNGVDSYLDCVSVVYPGAPTDFNHEIEVNIDLVLADKTTLKKFDRTASSLLSNLMICEEVEEHVLEYVIHGSVTNDLYNILFNEDLQGEVKVPEWNEDHEEIEHPTEEAEILLLELISCVSLGFNASEQNLSYY
jgi:hypothetical protein